MAFDIEMIKQVYARLETSVSNARQLTGKPLTDSLNTQINNITY